MTNKLIPSILVPELFFPEMNNEDNLINIVEKICDIGFYRSIELGMVWDSKNIATIRKLAELNDIMITQWITFELAKRNLSLSSLDADIRNQAVNLTKELVHLAADMGTRKLSIISGGVLEPSQKNEAKKCLTDSVIAISEEMKQYPNMLLQIEPLDCFAHKKQVIGFTHETVQWISAIREDCPNLYIAWDSAHTRLNEENATESLLRAAPFISQLHLSNAVLDPSDKLYGDFHMKLGKPGFLTEESVLPILKTAKNLYISPNIKELTVAVEVRTSTDDDLWENERNCREFLTKALGAI